LLERCNNCNGKMRLTEVVSCKNRFKIYSMLSQWITPRLIVLKMWVLENVVTEL
jgi:hypothetical protein